MIFTFPVYIEVNAKTRNEAKISLNNFLHLANIMYPGSTVAEPKFPYTIGNPIAPPDEPTVPKPGKNSVMDKKDTGRDK